MGISRGGRKKYFLESGDREKNRVDICRGGSKYKKYLYRKKNWSGNVLKIYIYTATNTDI